MVLVLALTAFASFPTYIKQHKDLYARLNIDNEQAFSSSLHADFPNITIVTFSSDGYSDPLENMIGSLHVWATGIPIAVYDLGLSPSSLAKIKTLKNVQVVYFNNSHYPKHVEFMNNYAFKPLLLLDAVNRFGTVLSLDAGIEVRSSLRRVFETIHTTGYFFVEASEVDPLSRVHPATVNALDMPAPSSEERQCYAGMHGYRAGSLAVKHVLQPTARCALSAACIDPPGSGHNNHRYEQAVFSLYIRSLKLHCHTSRVYSEHLPTTLDPDVLAPNQAQVFFFRRWRYPKPYAPMAARTSSITSVTSFAMQSAAVFENGFTDRKTSDNALLGCLRAHGYDLTQCATEEAAWRHKAAQQPLLGTAQLRQRELMRGWFLTQAAWVFWLWPLTMIDALALCVVGLIILGLDIYPRSHSRSGHLLVVVAMVGFFVWRVSPSQACAPQGMVQWRAAPSQPIPQLDSFKGTVQCDTVSSKLTFDTHAMAVLHEAREHLFFESTRLGQGVISLAIRHSTDWIHDGAVLVEPFLLQRPCVFFHRKRAYMLPRTPSLRRVLLYTTNRFPRGWQVLRDLADVAPESTAVLHQADDHWFLVVANSTHTLVTRAVHPEGPYVMERIPPMLSPSSAVCQGTNTAPSP